MRFISPTPVGRMFPTLYPPYSNVCGDFVLQCYFVGLCGKLCQYYFFTNKITNKWQVILTYQSS